MSAITINPNRVGRIYRAKPGPLPVFALSSLAAVLRVSAEELPDLVAGTICSCEVVRNQDKGAPVHPRHSTVKLYLRGHANLKGKRSAPWTMRTVVSLAMDYCDTRTPVSAAEFVARRVAIEELAGRLNAARWHLPSWLAILNTIQSGAAA